jgi:hypothetical protein
MEKINRKPKRVKDGFTKTPHGFYKRLWELKGARLAVWDLHRNMENAKGESWPSLELVSECTGYSITKIKLARQWLRANGWLISTGQKHSAKGNFSITIYRTAIPRLAVQKRDHGGTDRVAKSASRKPTVARKPDHGKNAAVNKPDHGAVVNKTDVYKPGLEVDIKNPEVEIVDADLRNGQNASTISQSSGERRFALPDWIPVERWDGFENSRPRQMNNASKLASLELLTQFRNEGLDISEIMLYATANRCGLCRPPKRKSYKAPGSDTTEDHRARFERNARAAGIRVPGSDTTQDHVDRIMRNAEVLGVKPN